MLDEIGVLAGTRSVIAQLRSKTDAEIADINKYKSDAEAELLTITDPIKRDIQTLLITQICTVMNSLEREFELMVSTLMMGDIMLRLLERKASSKDARAVARRETRRLMKTLEERIETRGRQRWFRGSFPSEKR
jgi:hypothetical protein